MPAPGKTTFDGNPNTTPATTAPYRPGTPDFNGMGIVNSQQFPPDPSTMPTADLLNTWSAFAIALARLCQMATVSVRYSAGPILDSFVAAPTAVIAGTFTIVRTGGGAGAGDVSITWPAGTFPSAVSQPEASLNGIVPGMIACAAITNGVRVVVQDKTGAGVDLPFTVCLM